MTTNKITVDNTDLLTLTGVSSAVNNIEVTNAVTTETPKISATGTDTDVDLQLEAKGAGKIVLTDSTGFSSSRTPLVGISRTETVPDTTDESALRVEYNYDNTTDKTLNRAAAGDFSLTTGGTGGSTRTGDDALTSIVGQTIVADGTSGTFSELSAITARSLMGSGNTATVTQFNGLYTEVTGGTGTVGTAAGLKIENVTAGDTNNYSIQVTGNADSTFNNTKLMDVADPTAAQDVATKNYVDTEIAAIPSQTSVDSTFDINSVAATDSVLTIDSPINYDSSIELHEAGNKMFDIVHSTGGGNVTRFKGYDSSGLNPKNLLQLSYTSDQISLGDAGVKTVINDDLYIVGDFTSPSGSFTFADASGNEAVVFRDIGSANYMELDNASTTQPVAINAVGTDTDIDIKINPKGSGEVNVNTAKIVRVGDPTADQDAATKKYVDDNNTVTSTTDNVSSLLTLTDATNISWEANDGTVATVTLAGNRTLDNIVHALAGGRYRIIVKQDATGGRTLSYGSLYKWVGGVAPTLSTGANAVDVLTFVSDGTNLYGVSHLNFS